MVPGHAKWLYYVYDFAFEVLDAVQHYRMAHHRDRGHIQVSLIDWARITKGAGMERPPSRGLLWGLPVSGDASIAEGRIKLFVSRVDQR
jgi:hypothetical protein